MRTFIIYKTWGGILRDEEVRTVSTFSRQRKYVGVPLGQLIQASAFFLTTTGVTNNGYWTNNVSEILELVMKTNDKLFSKGGFD